MSSIIYRAYEELFGHPPEEKGFLITIDYSGHFSDFNSNIRLRNKRIFIKLGKDWEKVDDEIQIGLVQHLLLKLLKKRGIIPVVKKTNNMDLYSLFVKNLHIGIPKSNINPVLLESFNRVNEQYFLGLVECPNLIWGPLSTRTLGRYDFHTDTITMSRVFENCTPSEKVFLDLVMYHEILHKKHKFRSSGSKNFYHTAKFKTAEKAFENSEELEKKMRFFLSKKRVSGEISNTFRKLFPF